eukprot:TRINITY_DN11582_c0_g1_i1.p1 TRINITY_DN11582_c0_g1~~TRINITY_DN11582_c0_g1_i1.p1  ORF type:complete len:353 (+),score=44.24 TRINITY_DN11582_c0_g1_i1:51-1061(+)
MGCGASSHNGDMESDGSEYGPDGLRLHEWWVAGEVNPGVTTRSGEVVPAKGPFEYDKKAQPGIHADAIKFGTEAVGKDGSHSDPSPVFKYGDPIYSRAFFTHSLPCFSVGWARLELSKDRPHYNTKKIKERDSALASQGQTPDYSKRRKYFLYPESIKEIGVFMSINNKHVVTPTAVSCDSWACDPIEGAFFTFTPDRGSVYGLGNSAPETSLPIFLRPSEADDEHYKDPRWSRLNLEMLKAIQKSGSGTHSIKLEVKYRYGNWKFVAWNESDSKSGKVPAYRYSDEERDQEEATSVTVSKGEFKLKITKDELKAIPEEIEKLDKVYNTAADSNTQ